MASSKCILVLKHYGIHQMLGLLQSSLTFLVNKPQLVTIFHNNYLLDYVFFLFLLKIRWFLSITINYQARVCKPVIFLTTLKPAPLIILQFVTPTVFAVINFLTTTTGIYVKPQQKTLIKQNFTKLLISKIVPTTTVSFCYSNLNRYKLGC